LVGRCAVAPTWSRADHR